MSIDFGNVTYVCGFGNAIFKDIITGIEKSQKMMAVMMENLLKLSQKWKKQRLYAW